MKEENKIKLVQAPKIEHQLAEAGKRVTERIDALDLDNQVATADTVKSLKTTRAELKKEYEEYESDRKIIKNACLGPYNDLNEIYKKEIAEKYETADSTLKDKIGSVEMKVKEDREAEVKAYFIELCLSEDIDFVTYNQLGIEIKLSDSMKSYKDRCNDFVQQICKDVDLIKTEEFEAEIMVEYKKTLDVSGSIKSIRDRKEQERQEKERIKQLEIVRRTNELEQIGMKFDKETKTFVYSDEIYISKDVVEQFEKIDFNNKKVELETIILADIKSKEVKKEQPKKAEPVQQTIQPEKKEVRKPEPIKAPKVEEKLEILTAEFRVKGTLQQLKALGQYMKDNNLTYENI
jgi:hypothetical protein